jgi:formate--tetrahydrofolate ligase
LALIHGGPFANIAHGCNSVFATKTAMNIADYTITEAGFGSDLGAEKFMDIVCNNANIKPNCIVLVTSIRSLKMHGGVDKNNLNIEDLASLKTGFSNLDQHIKNLQAFNIPIVIAINSFNTDTVKEVKCLKEYLTSNKIDYSFTTLFKDGSKGATDLAHKVVKLANKKSNLKLVYKLTDKLDEKIRKIITRCYGATNVEYNDIAKDKLRKLMNTKSYVCIAKTPLTFSDNPKQIIIEGSFTIHVKDLLVANGANFIIVMAGSIFRMPGLPKIPAACKM